MSTLKNKSKSELIEEIEALKKQVQVFERIELESKQTDDVLKESEKWYRQYFMQDKTGVFITNVEGKLLDCNPAFIEIFGFKSLEEAKTYDMHNLYTTKQDRADFLELVRKEKTLLDNVWTMQKVNGEPVIINEKINGIFNNEGELVQLRGFLLDITERKKAEEALRESEERYRAVIEQSKDCIFLVDVNSKLILEANSSMQKLLGYTADEMIKLSLYELIAHDKDSIDKNIDQIVSDGYKYIGEREYFRKDGSKVYVEVSVSLISYRENRMLCIVSRNITERKQAEKQYHAFFTKNVLSVEWVELKNPIPIDLPIEEQVDMIFREAYIKDVSESCAAIYGLSREQLIGQPISAEWAPGFEDRNSTTHQYYQSFIRAGYSDYLTEAGPTTTQEGKQKWYLVSIQGFVEKGHLTRFWGSQIDITERKKAEEALRDSERKFREMADLLPLIVYEIDINRNLTFFNKQASAIFGFSEHDIMSNFNALDRVIPEDKDRALENMKKIMNGKSIRNTEYTLIKKDGSTFPVLVYSNRVMKDNKPVGLRGIIVDISERKQAEEALKESEEKFSKSFFDNPTPMIIINTKTGDRIDVNDSYVKMSGFDRNELLEGNINKRNLALSQKRLKEIIRKTIKKGYVSNEYFKFVNKTGEIITTLLSGTKLNVSDGNKVVYSCLDVTEREESQSKLKESEFFLSEAQRIANLGSYELDILSGYWTCTNELKSIFGIDDNYDRSIKGWGNIVHPKEKENMLSYFKNNVLKEHQNFDKEYRIIRINNNEERWVHGLGELEFNAEGQPVKMIGTIQDITENKIAEKKLMASRNQLRSLAERLQMIREEERATVAREIHDDLGQTLTALKMDITWMKKNPGMTAEIRTSKINTMLGLIDTTIQTVKRIATELRPGILDDLGLVSAIEWQTKEFQNRSGIECDFEIFVDEFTIEDEISIAVFRIFQESLTNIARHSGATKVTVTIEKANNYLQLDITDNGVGITEDQINNSKSLGLIGMNERVSVFRGKLTITRAAEGGTTVRVRIPIMKIK